MMKIALALALFATGAEGADISTDTCWTKVNTVVAYSQIECQDQSLTGWVPANNLYSPSVKTDLTSIKVYKNKLSGWMPTEIGQLTRLKVYVDYRNEISGYLPSEIGVLTAMTELNIYKNKVSGTIPEQAGGDPDNWPASKVDWNNFVIMNNKFSGCIPMELTVCSDDLPNNSVNGYCSMSTQGAPGIDGNCGTLAPTSAAPTTSAPTTIPVCEWGVVGRGPRKGNPVYSDGVKRRKKIIGCKPATVPSSDSSCADAKSERVCDQASGCKWYVKYEKKGRKRTSSGMCRKATTQCGSGVGAGVYMNACEAAGNGDLCVWKGSKYQTTSNGGECLDISTSCAAATFEKDCLKVASGCRWAAVGRKKVGKIFKKTFKCVNMPNTCEAADALGKNVCLKIGTFSPAPGPAGQ
jgi:hypothetical protein